MESEMYRYNSESPGLSLRTKRKISIMNTVAAFFDRLAAAQDRRRQRHALARLDDRMLRDIGLSMSDVEVELAKPFWR